jgi:hypothetical protein
LQYTATDASADTNFAGAAQPITLVYPTIAIIVDPITPLLAGFCRIDRCTLRATPIIALYYTLAFTLPTTGETNVTKTESLVLTPIAIIITPITNLESGLLGLLTTDFAIYASIVARRAHALNASLTEIAVSPRTDVIIVDHPVTIIVDAITDFGGHTGSRLSITPGRHHTIADDAPGVLTGAHAHETILANLIIFIDPLITIVIDTVTRLDGRH